MNYWVVVVDDEIISLTNAKNILSGVGMKVSRLKSGQDLLAFMTKNSPDLILLDIMMPEMDGFEAYRLLRKFEEENGRKNTPVIFLTGTDNPETEQRGLKEGASDFIRKPFNKDILIHRILNTLTNVKTIETLMDEATTDKLTGFWNRAAGTKRMKEFCETKNGMMFVMDLDNFKLVNDLHGHEMGDNVLKAFANVVRKNTREEDLTVRIGGDEFTAFLCRMSDEKALAAYCKRLNEQFLEEVKKLFDGSFDLPLGISIGAVNIPNYGRDYDVLFPFADDALYKAKHSGKHGYVLYVEEKSEELSAEDSLQKEMERITQIVEERSDKGGALLLGIDLFSSIYRFVKRFFLRHGGSISKVLFLLSGKDADAVKDTAKQFGDCLQKSLRRSDVIIQNKPHQFFLLMPGLEDSDVHSVIHRVMSHWENYPHDNPVEITYISDSTFYEGKKFPPKS